MSQNVVYFDNAATTYPKPSSVYKACDAYLHQAANPGRGAHGMAIESARIIHEARTAVASAFGISSAERLVFTPGCTASLNMVIKGSSLGYEDVVLVSALEHNAVMRPLRQLETNLGIRVVVLPYAPQGIVDLHALVEALLAETPRLCIISEASNVTGETVDLSSIAAICAANRVPLVIDAAQSAGRVLRPVEMPGVSFWCASGHKGLMGPAGVGLLYVAPDMDLEPLIAGGT